MSNDLESRVVKLESLVDEHHEILGGGTKQDQPGLMHLMRELWKDVYNEKNGLKPRMDKWEWWARGAYGMAIVIIALLAWLWTNRSTLH